MILILKLLKHDSLPKGKKYNMYIVKETTKHGVVIHHGPFITMKGIRAFQQAKFEAGSKTVAKNLFVPVWNKEEK